MPSIQERYVTELRDRDPSTVDVLFLDNCEGGEISGLSDKLTNLESLSLVNCELKSFKGLPSLPKLTHLDASNNCLNKDAALDVIVKNTPSIERLNLSANKFDSIENLRPLKMLQNLTELDLSGIAVLGMTESYREKMFDMIPSLKVLDGCDADGNEVEEEFDGEAGEDSEEDDSGDDEDGPGLSYLDKSQFSDDETDDYKPEDGESRGVKRGAEDTEDEPEAKKKDEKAE